MARVVISKEDFSLDKAVLSRADESAALFASSPVWTPPPILDEAHQPLPTEFGRAAIYGAIASLSQGRAGVRSVVLQMLVQMLELEVIPCFSAASKIGIELAAVLSGINTTCYYYALIMNSDAVFLSSGLEKLTLTEHEAEVLIKGHFYYTGMAALLAYSAQATMNMVDVVAGVSCEAVNASSEPFSASNYEIHRPHRGMMSSAGNLRLMVEGSKRVTPAATHPEPCFVSIPNFHGPAAELVNAAIK
jgi:histidine ammonia-lyase